MSSTLCLSHDRLELQRGFWTYSKLAVCSILTTLEMIASLSVGTFSHALNAAIICPRISFPGMENICVNGSRRAYVVVSEDLPTREGMFTNRLVCLRPGGRFGKNLPYVEGRIILAGTHDVISLSFGTLPFVYKGGGQTGQEDTGEGGGVSLSRRAKSRCGTDAVPSLTEPY